MNRADRIREVLMRALRVMANPPIVRDRSSTTVMIAFALSLPDAELLGAFTDDDIKQLECVTSDAEQCAAAMMKETN